jgi:DNA polymerase-3 subunit epsilon
VREIVLDTETTGSDPETGDRVVEIGAVELFDHIPTGRTYHQYINPERIMPTEAFEVHGLGDDFLRDKPPFRDIAASFLEFIGDSILVAHDARFDLKFLNAELRWIGLDYIPEERVIDTLAIARKKFPGSPTSLDALCRRFSIDNSSRTLHGALLDSEILAELYYILGDFRKIREALADQVSMILRNSASASLSAQDTATNLRHAISTHLNDTRSNQLSDELQVFDDLATYFDNLSIRLHQKPPKKELEDRVRELEALVLELTSHSKDGRGIELRNNFVDSFVKTCGSTAAVALISGGTLLLGRYAPSAVDALMDIFSKP